MSEQRLSNGENGAEEREERDSRGRFQKGNRCSVGRGNPLASRVHELRAAILAAATPEEVRAVMQALAREAQQGSVPAAKEYLDRLVGKPVEADIDDRLKGLEELLTPRGLGLFS